MRPDVGRDLSGYVLDAWGAVHRLSVEGGGLPRLQTAGPYWPGRDLARGLAIVWSPDADRPLVRSGSSRRDIAELVTSTVDQLAHSDP